MLCDYVMVWAKVDGVVLDDLTSDRFVWRWTADGMYSASFAYRAFFFGMTSLRGAKELRKARAPRSASFFFLASVARSVMDGGTEESWPAS